jgi:hypothetical protein
LNLKLSSRDEVPIISYFSILADYNTLYEKDDVDKIYNKIIQYIIDYLPRAYEMLVSSADSTPNKEKLLKAVTDKYGVEFAGSVSHLSEKDLLDNYISIDDVELYSTAKIPYETYIKSVRTNYDRSVSVYKTLTEKWNAGEIIKTTSSQWKADTRHDCHALVSGFQPSTLAYLGVFDIETVRNGLRAIEMLTKYNDDATLSYKHSIET